MCIAAALDEAATPDDAEYVSPSVQRDRRMSLASSKRLSEIQVMCSGLVDRLKTAISTREDNSICKFLTPIITLLEGNGSGTVSNVDKKEHQKAFGKADLGAVLFLCMHELLTSPAVSMLCMH